MGYARNFEKLNKPVATELVLFSWFSKHRKYVEVA